MRAAIGSADDLSPRPPDPAPGRGSRACRWPTSRDRRTRVQRPAPSRTRPRTCSSTCARPGSTRARRASSSPTTTRRSPSRPPAAPRGDEERRRDGLGPRRPITAAADRAPRAARAREGPVRAVTTRSEDEKREARPRRRGARGRRPDGRTRHRWTVAHLLPALAERGLRDVRCVATSSPPGAGAGAGARCRALRGDRPSRHRDRRRRPGRRATAGS